MPAFDLKIPDPAADQAARESLGPLARAMASFTSFLAGDMEGEVTVRATTSPSP